MLKLILRSLLFYRQSSAYQAGIVFILAAIITGSLLTGYSVRESLRTSVNEHLGNTDFLISSGLRYFDPALSDKIEKAAEEKCVALLETTGYCQNFATGVTSLNTNIYGVTPEFFSFNGNDSIIILPSYIAINQDLSKRLNVNTGDEVIVHFREISPIPANSPFARSEKTAGTKVFKVSHILNKSQSGNFKLGISQVIPLNIFINVADLNTDLPTHNKANRLLLENKNGSTLFTLQKILKESLSPGDIGLKIRKFDKQDIEIISERIFIDKEIVSEITNSLPSARPVLTYLANQISKNHRSTPYSFIAGLPTDYTGIIAGNHIVINQWLADDLGASVNDTVKMFWYAPLANGKLEEKNNRFIISRIVGIDSIWGDPTLMPEFPGITGSGSCSDWDAGVPVNMKLIRDKDEAYWNNFRGTPKAFISYEKSKELWGSNFGPATAIRFAEPITIPEVEKALTGSFDPEKTGFSIIDIKSDSISAASDGVDFSTLFLSLGFFIILSCIILLSLSVSIFFDSKKDQIATFFALGFTDKFIKRLLLYETVAISLAGAIPGVLAGGVINRMIIFALNSVWSGAVQTNTLGAYFAGLPILTGFIATVLICIILLKFKSVHFLKTLKNAATGGYKGHSKQRNFIVFLLTSVFFVVAFVYSFLSKENSLLLSFVAGISLFVVLILLVRFYLIGGFKRNESKLFTRKSLSGLYYSFSPANAITPVILIAAGIFSVFITGVNRLNINDKMLETTGGTGGSLLWCETAVPVKQNLNEPSGRKEFGLDDEIIKDISFVQAKRASGDDASCLNLNHVTAPPLLGLDPSVFISNRSFSFATVMKGLKNQNPWEVLNQPPVGNTIYGIADQTVLQWGLKISPGDTIAMKSESGQALNVIIVAGLKSSVFQGFVLVGSDNFDMFYPSVPGSTVFITYGNPALVVGYEKILKDRFVNFGISVIPSQERLASFFEVTNTYLSVFTILGAFGMVLGVIGLGFILLRNYSQRRKEFALMSATGYSINVLRKMLITEQLWVLLAGIFTGTVSALTATLPSILNNSQLPWLLLLIMVFAVFLSGLAAIAVAVRSVRNESLIAGLRKE